MATRPPDRPHDVRASDEDREQAARRLRHHYGAGRLSEDELSARVGEVYDARTLPELEALTADLPDPLPATPGRPGVQPAPDPGLALTPAGRALRLSLRIDLAAYVLVNVLLVGVWAASGGGYFWPVWVILGWGIAVAGHAAPVIAGVGKRSGRTSALPPSRTVDAITAGPGTGAEDAALQRAAAPDGTVTILFSDIEGSTALNERLGDVRWLALLREHHAIVREQVRAHAGFEVKVQGDGFMIAFPSARRAIGCARAMQDAIGERLGEHPDGPVKVRVGLHTGEAIREDADFYGRNVVLAARIAGAARGGEILASAVVKHLTESAGDITFADGRELELAGLAGTHAVYSVS